MGYSPVIMTVLRASRPPASRPRAFYCSDDSMTLHTGTVFTSSQEFRRAILSECVPGVWVHRTLISLSICPLIVTLLPRCIGHSCGPESPDERSVSSVYACVWAKISPACVALAAPTLHSAQDQDDQLFAVVTLPMPLIPAPVLEPGSLRGKRQGIERSQSLRAVELSQATVICPSRVTLVLELCSMRKCRKACYSLHITTHRSPPPPGPTELERCLS